MSFLFAYDEHQKTHDFDAITMAAMNIRYKQVALDEDVAGMVLAEAMEMELLRLERKHPEIAKVNWGPDGSVLFAPDV